MARKLRRKAEENETPMDMTPMIDCIFLLLIFFMLTTKFTPDEKSIASLMPTDKGQAQASSPSPVPKEQVNIKIYPRTPGPTNQFVKGYQPSEYKQFLSVFLSGPKEGLPINSILVQVGGDNAVPVDGEYLALKGGPELEANLNNFQAAIRQGLTSRENNATIRKDAPPIIIHCYSRLPWKFAILAYDAVRDYEASVAGAGIITKNEELINAREVTFAPPRIRNYSSNEDGNEIFEIINMQ